MLNRASQKFTFTLEEIAMSWGRGARALCAPYGSALATESFCMTSANRFGNIEILLLWSLSTARQVTSYMGVV